MTRLLPSLALLATLVLAPAAHAQLFRAYLSPTGNDTNPCTLAQPCRLLPKALTVVNDGGEIWMLDSGNYNTATVNVTKSVAILAVPGALGSVVAAGGPALSFAVGGGTLVLRNLVIVPLPGASGTDGIYVTNGAKLTIEGCVLASLPGSGVVVESETRVRVVDTTIRDNGADGIRIMAGAHATVTRSVLSGNAQRGLHVYGTITMTTRADITDSTLSGNNVGVRVYSNGAAGVATATIRRSLITNGDYGVMMESFGSGILATAIVSESTISNMVQMGMWAYGSPSRAIVTRSTLAHNATAFVVEAGIFETAGNNALRNNGADTAAMNGGTFATATSM